MNPSALEDLWTVVRLAAEGSDWKRDQGETLSAWAQRRLARPESHTHWLEDELVEVMRIVAPGMVGRQPDEITYAMLITAIRRLMEADEVRYEALLERWTDKELEKLRAAVDSLSSVNCWFAEYDMRPMIYRELQRRATRQDAETLKAVKAQK